MLDRIKAVANDLKIIFLSGLFTLIPIAATLFFISFLYTTISRGIEPLRQMEPLFLQRIPGSEFILVMLFILLLGIVLRAFIANSIIHYFEGLINRIPLVRIVYSSAKIVVDFFKVSDNKIPFKRKVVLIPYPRNGQYHLAFLLESAEHTYQPIIPDSFKAHPDEKYVKVFMPNSPNPTSGYFFIMLASDVIETDISFEEAIKTLVSCGLVTPDSLKKRHH
jgi:uncharacterized membrane protein